MTRELDFRKQFAASYSGIVDLLHAAIRCWPRLPDGWDCYDENLRQIYLLRHDLAALLTLRGRETPENARAILANLVSCCANAKESAQRCPCTPDTLRAVLHDVGEAAGPIQQCLALIIQECELKPLASATKSPGSSNGASELEILPGGIRCDGHTVELGGKPLACLRVLYDAHHRRLDWQTLGDRVWGEDSYTDKGTVKNAIKEARAALRTLARKRDGRLEADYDPIPCVNRGVDLAWKLDFPR
jgi:hypothetical protein